MQRGLLVCVVGAALLLGASARVFAQTGQTTVYHLHNEASGHTGAAKALKTVGPDILQTITLQSTNLKQQSNTAINISSFGTPIGVPNRAGSIPAGSTITFNLLMRVTSLPNTGSAVYPRGQVYLNSTFGTSLCVGTGSQALTLVFNWYQFSCSVGSSIPMAASDVFVLAVRVYISGSMPNKNAFGELNIEANADSTVEIPNPAPSITLLNPTSGIVGQSITITGTAFGATQGTSTIKFSGTTASVTSWSDTSITASVPAGIASGAVVVIVSNTQSNSVAFTVLPHISSVTPAAAFQGETVTIAGTSFGASPSVTFNGTTAAPSTWSDSSIGVPVPSGASTGPVLVTVAGNASNSVAFTVITNGTVTGTITRSTGGTAVSGAAVQAVLAGIIKGAATTATDGTYSIPGLSPGTYDVRVAATGFAPEVRQNIAVVGSTSTTVNVALLQAGSIGGTVTQPNGTTPISGASVVLFQNGIQKATSSTNASGVYSLNSLHPGSSTLQVSSVGYATQEAGVTISENSNTTRDVSLQTAAVGQVTYVYDEIGRLVSVTDPGANTATYRYDAVGNITAIERPGSASVSISEFTPNSAPVGTTVLIYGTGFSATPSSNAVTFNGSAATVTAASASQLTVTVPAGATTGPIGVTAPGGSATTSTSFTVTAASSGPPTITNFSPQIWAGTGSLTITGTNFDTTLINDRVMLNGLNGAVTNATATSLTVQVPQVASSGHVSVVTLIGSATSSGDFFVPPVGYSSSNIQDTARMTVGGNSLPLSFPAGGKFSLLVFDGTPGHRVGATFSSIALPNGSAAMYDPAGARTASAFVDAGYVETGTITSSSSYTLLVEAPPGNTGSATVTLSDIVDQAATIVADGPAVTISTTAAGQNGLVTFSGTAGQRISLVASNPTVNNGQSFFCDMNLIVTKPNGATLFPSPICAEVGAFVDTTVLPVSGTYTIIVDLANLATGSVTLNLYTVPPDFTGTISAGGSSVTVTTTVAGQNGLLTFSGTSGARIALLGMSSSYGGTPVTCDVTVAILNPDDSVLAPALCMELGGFIDTTSLPSTGTYKIQIDPYTVATGNLTLTLYSVPADVTGTITIGGSAVPVSLSAIGQNGSFTFSANANQHISLQVTDASGFNTPFECDVNVSILKPDNSPLVNPTCMDAGGTIGSTAIPTTGTYTIFVNPVGTNTGSLTLTLTEVP